MSRMFRLGIFIVGGLIILAAGIFLIGSKELLFSSTYSVKAGFENVSGLIGGAEVRVGGLREGTVKRIDLPKRPDQKVTVILDLKSATRGILKQDSVASIKSEGLLGDKFVEVSFGSASAAKLNNGDTIESAPPLDISDLMQKTDQILDTAKSAMKNIDGATDSLQSVSRKIDAGKGTFGALVNDKTMYKQVSAGATAFQEDMEALKHNFFLRGFFKKRGYEDSEDLNKNVVANLPSEPPSKIFTLDVQQVFDKPDTAKLKHEKLLNEAGQFLQANKFGTAVVAVCGGMKGDTDKVRESTEGQAFAVRKYLVDTFRVDDTRVKTIGLGKAQDPSDSYQLKIFVYPPGNAPVASKAH